MIFGIDARENILSPACLTVFVKSKTDNQLIRFVIAYLIADNNLKCETMLQRETLASGPAAAPFTKATASTT